MTHSTPSTTCPDLGAWRAWLDRVDHEASAPDLADHLDGCAACQQQVADLRRNASLASDALRLVSAAPVPSVSEVALARERLAWRQREPVAEPVSPAPAPAPVPTFLSRIPSGWRVAVSGIAAALLMVVVVAFTPEGRTAAAGFLAQFRSQQVAAIEISPQSAAEISHTVDSLSNLGTVRTPANMQRGGMFGRVDENAASLTLDQASRAAGFAVQTPDPSTLPAGVDRTPRIQSMPAGEIRFVFDKTKASNYFRSTGHPEVTLPDKFDGATLIISMPAGVLLQYGGRDTHQALLIGESGELVVDVQGNVGLDELRDFLLGLPGLPKETTDQLRMIRNWNQTLPVPVLTDKVNWKKENFKGGQGLLLNDNSGVGSAAIYQSGGHLFGVAGSMKATDLKRVADSLAVR